MNRASVAEPRPKRTKTFHHEGTKDTKKTKSIFKISEPFVAFVSFVVRIRSRDYLITHYSSIPRFPSSCVDCL
jgi:hypothetical protein